jgi:hypothetical protein
VNAISGSQFDSWLASEIDQDQEVQEQPPDDFLEFMAWVGKQLDAEERERWQDPAYAAAMEFQAGMLACETE